ncbi:MAG: hypothetical protein AAB605_04090 [Patescibacteria group bacterium]
MSNALRLTQGYSFRHLVWILCGITILWVAAYAGFILILPLLGLTLSYTETPLLSAAYYVAWIAVALFFFPKTLTRVHLDQSRNAYVALAVFVSLTAFFYSSVLPSLSEYGAITVQSGNFFLGATPAFFLPKMAELVFQQLLIAALVLSIASFDNNVFFVSLLYGPLFAIGHVLVLLEVPAAFVELVIVGAVVSAATFPYLILRVRNGFIYSFMLHWAFYIVLTVLFLS